MIAIDLERCTGCGICVEACPTSALFLVDGRAALDNSLCRESEDCPAAGPVPCVSACPNCAIMLVGQALPHVEPAVVPVIHHEPEVIAVRVPPAVVPFRSRALPAIGAALAWAGRAIVPVVGDLLLDTLDRYTYRRQALDTGRRGTPGRRVSRGGGRRHRHRRRGHD